MAAAEAATATGAAAACIIIPAWVRDAAAAASRSAWWRRSMAADAVDALCLARAKSERGREKVGFDGVCASPLDDALFSASDDDERIG